jgi:hypothetical protein
VLLGEQSLSDAPGHGMDRSICVAGCKVRKPYTTAVNHYMQLRSHSFVHRVKFVGNYAARMLYALAAT